jgi:iron(II)-dependent oxidoreductase
LADWRREARTRTLALVSDLDGDRWLGPRLRIVNPPAWEIGHVAWFCEKWVLRHAAKRAPIRADADALYDSAAIPHDVRWDLPLPDRAGTFAYAAEVLDRILDRLGREELSAEDVYFARLAVFHEDMHGEAFAMTRQTLGYEAPARELDDADGPLGDGPPGPGDARIPGGTFALGAARNEAFVFDNEKWAHPVEVKPFSIARCAVTAGEFARFVEDGGYLSPAHWSAPGLAWLRASGAKAPIAWRNAGGRWWRRRYDRWVPLEPRVAVVNVNAFEAEAYCAWAGRRLPTELEWEVACAGTPDPATGALAGGKRRHAWGDEPWREEFANLDARRGQPIDVAAGAAGSSGFGCRQMGGNVWEWTATPFAPYPGFTPDPYAEYSQPWFGDHRVLRGGSFVTRARLLRATWRNFYTPERRDVFAGFRTCALD